MRKHPVFRPLSCLPAACLAALLYAAAPAQADDPLPPDVEEAMKEQYCAMKVGGDQNPQDIRRCREEEFGDKVHYSRADCRKDIASVRNKAMAGDTEAQKTLGDCYSFGDGVEEDGIRAAEWFRKAAEQGHGGAQASLGFLYEYGWGVPKDKNRAVEWYRKAAAQGHENAQDRLRELGETW